MYFRYLSKLTFDQLLYTDMDSVIMYWDFNRANHVMLLMSDLLGNLKDKYKDVLKEHPTWYVDEIIAFGPMMYLLILRDKISGEVVKWNKTMKGISLHGDPSRFSSDKLHLYRNPVIDFCCVLQYGNKFKFQTMDQVWHAMYDLKRKRSKDMNGNQQPSTTISVVITLDQHVFKQELAKVFTDSFILSRSIKKKIRVTQCKRLPKPDKLIPLGITFPIGGVNDFFFLHHNRSSLCGIPTANGRKFVFTEKEWQSINDGII